MKTQDTITLNLAATLLAGILSSFMLFVLSNTFTPAILLPIVFSIGAAVFQYTCVIKPWHKALGELLGKALNLQESVSASPGTKPEPAPPPAEPEAKKSKTGETKKSPTGETKKPPTGELKKSTTGETRKSVTGETDTSIVSGNIDQAITGVDQLSALRHSIEVATEKTRENRLRENALIQHAVDVICVIDLQAKLLQVNPASTSVWGYRPEELIGRQITDFLVSDDVKNTMKAILGAEKSIDKMYFENRFRKKSGEIVDMYWSAHLSASDRGLFCIAHDITERKRAERLLRESEERLRGILQSLPAGVVLVDKEGKIDFMNTTALELSGYQESELKAKSASKLFSFYDDNSPDDFESSIPKSGPSFDCVITRSTGERFPAEASTRKINRSSGGTAHLVIFLDVTMKHEVEQAKREFVAMVSHDLRTPLTAISLIFAYMLDGLAGDLSEDGIDFAKRGQSSCDRLMTLVQDLLDLEKMRAGKFVMSMEETSIQELVTASIDAVKPYADAQEIKLAAICEDIKCYCDGARIIQVLINLISNAIKFSVSNGTVYIEAKNGSDFLTLCVSNKGKTIAHDKLTSIFEKFEQADSSGAIERKGTGLGLTISKTIIEQHSCKIWVESSDDKGTVFSFTIPKTAPVTDQTSQAVVS